MLGKFLLKALELISMARF